MKWKRIDLLLNVSVHIHTLSFINKVLHFNTTIKLLKHLLLWNTGLLLSSMAGMHDMLCYCIKPFHPFYQWQVSYRETEKYI